LYVVYATSPVESRTPPGKSKKTSNTSATTKELTIAVMYAANYMKEIGKDVFSRVEKINVKVFGNVINFDKTTGILTIRPIAIH